MRQEGGQQHRKRFGQHLCNALYKIKIKKEGGTRPSKTFTTIIAPEGDSLSTPISDGTI